MASWLISAERGSPSLYCSVVTAVILPFLIVTLTCVLPYRSVSSAPDTVFDVPSGVLEGAGAALVVGAAAGAVLDGVVAPEGAAVPAGAAPARLDGGSGLENQGAAGAAGGGRGPHGGRAHWGSPPKPNNPK